MLVTSTRQPKARSGYSSEVKAATLAALAINSGNVKKTARQMGIPRRTVNAWALGRGISARVKAEAERFQKPLVDLFYDLLCSLLEELSKPERIEDASFRDLTRLLDIATDKWLILINDPVTWNWRSGRAPKMKY